jgi:serine-type D-Ala-D-Ala carboxypeptidase (penicillin-binding protein 5/6)
MKIRVLWVAGFAAFCLFLLSVTLPNPGFAKTTARTSKSSHPARVEGSPPAGSGPSSQPGQGGQGALQCDAQAAVLMDGLTGQVLYEQNPSSRIAPASFVKVLTLYVVYDAIRAGQLKLDDMVTVSENAWRRAYKTDSSKMFIRIGDRVKVEDLIKGVAIASGNDACVALAEHLSGTEETFVTKMNEKAKSIGLANSQFRNSDGLPAEGQYITAMDMATLSRRYVEDHPEALAIHSTTEFLYNGIRQGNRNTLLYKNIGVDGLKTGHVAESGYHLVATAKRGDQRMIAVVMGCEKVKRRGPEAEKLLDYGFKNFVTLQPVKKGDSFGPLKVTRGKLKDVMLAATADTRVTVAKGKEKSVTAIPQLPPSAAAPVQKGQILAKAVVQNEGKIVAEVNLAAAGDVPKTLIPPWPVMLGGLIGLAIVLLAGFWFVRRPRQNY